MHGQTQRVFHDEHINAEHFDELMQFGFEKGTLRMDLLGKRFAASGSPDGLPGDPFIGRMLKVGFRNRKAVPRLTVELAGEPEYGVAVLRQYTRPFAGFERNAVCAVKPS